MNAYPAVPLSTLGNQLDHIANWIRHFVYVHVDTFDKDPDERAMTALLVTFLSFVANPAPAIYCPTQAEEALLGYDFSIKYTETDGHGVQRLVEVLIQAKVMKPDSTDAPHVNWYYDNANGYQIDLLATAVVNARQTQQNAHVVGGYIIYSSDAVQFVPLAAIDNALADVGGRNVSAQQERWLTDRLCVTNGANYPLRLLGTFPMQ
ncbi:hypothetical protein FA95DRAFT_1559066 [Auriscalpium vulgare]|uniref:Uncharacterized protein n=1 Tax=Auriscalpium vulgare TaxID=40419 RepID=A0ACB8RU09_9AGAM|nr:hypothetical protein FA95DRAFT_1559066 [Auriscalpium vulgare]